MTEKAHPHPEEKKPDAKPKPKETTLGDKAKNFLIGCLIVLGTIAVGGALIQACFDSFGDFVRGMNGSLINGSIHATQTSIALSMFLNGITGIVVKVLLTVALLMLGFLGIRRIKSWMDG